MLVKRHLLILSLSACFSAEVFGNSAAAPVDRQGNEPWMNRHLAFAEIAERESGCQLLFLGDSITDHWRSKAVDLWNERYAPLNAVNFGISGDRTQHLLWRLQNGAIGNLRPQMVVMMIGTNNIGFNSDGVTPRNTLTEIAEGIAANVHYLRERLPEAKILLLAIFPRGEADSQERRDSAEVNQQIAALHDNNYVIFLDIGEHFLEPDGTLPTTVMPDLLHPNTMGYAIWADAIQKPIAELMR